MVHVPDRNVNSFKKHVKLAELPVLRTDFKVFLSLYFFSLSWQLEFEDQPPYASWVASRDRRAMHATPIHIAWAARSNVHPIPYGLAVDVLRAHARHSSN